MQHVSPSAQLATRLRTSCGMNRRCESLASEISGLGADGCQTGGGETLEKVTDPTQSLIKRLVRVTRT